MVNGIGAEAASAANVVPAVRGGRGRDLVRRRRSPRPTGDLFRRGRRQRPSPRQTKSWPRRHPRRKRSGPRRRPRRRRCPGQGGGRGRQGRDQGGILGGGRFAWPHWPRPFPPRTPPRPRLVCRGRRLGPDLFRRGRRRRPSPRRTRSWPSRRPRRKRSGSRRRPRRTVRPFYRCVAHLTVVQTLAVSDLASWLLHLTDQCEGGSRRLPHV